MVWAANSVGSLFPVERAGNILISFSNNFAARDAIPFVQQFNNPAFTIEFTPSPVKCMLSCDRASTTSAATN